MFRAKLIFYTITFICIVVLAISYFLPVEDSWSPVDAWKGYYDASGHVDDLNSAVFEVFPFAAGLIILFALLLLRFPKIPIIMIIIYGLIWAVSVTVESFRIKTSSGYRFENFWYIFAIATICCLFVILLLTILKFKNRLAVLSLCLLLAAASLIQQSCSIAWYILEDGQLLNIGSVTGPATATGLIISLLYIILLPNKQL